MGQWGFGKNGDLAGTVCLFTGEPGTGKTLAAEAVGFETGKPLKVRWTFKQILHLLLLFLLSRFVLVRFHVFVCDIWHVGPWCMLYVQVRASFKCLLAIQCSSSMYAGLYQICRLFATFTAL